MCMYLGFEKNGRNARVNVIVNGRTEVQTDEWNDSDGRKSEPLYRNLLKMINMKVCPCKKVSGR